VAVPVHGMDRSASFFFNKYCKATEEEKRQFLLFYAFQTISAGKNEGRHCQDLKGTPYGLIPL
jgi:hypothetical protein